jgi:hypothetical protein
MEKSKFSEKFSTLMEMFEKSQLLIKLEMPGNGTGSDEFRSSEDPTSGQNDCQITTSPENSYPYPPGVDVHKTFYGRNLRMFVIS